MTLDEMSCRAQAQAAKLWYCPTCGKVIWVPREWAWMYDYANGRENRMDAHRAWHATDSKP